MLSVVVRHTLEGFHSWPDAPPHRAYLGYQHRHLFHIEVGVAVTNPQRQVEFHDLRDAVVEGLPRPPAQFVDQSCEQIATELREHVRRELHLAPDHPVRVSVFEDGECGAVLE